MRKTKIICTLGPASDRGDVLERMFDSGMNCARFNFSHGTHQEHKVRIDRVRKLCREKGVQIPLLLDTKGPEIRLGNFQHGSEVLKEGELFTLTSRSVSGTASVSGVSFPDLSLYVKENDIILIDDGKLSLEVERIDGQDIVCRISTGGVIQDHKSINIPNRPIPMPYLRDADKSDILFGIQEDMDYIAASFVRTADDVCCLRKFLADNGGDKIKIISKIENRQGLDNLDAIIEASDGIMVARGDLGVEIPFKYLPAVQKEIIDKCYKSGKHVVTATQMLESMIRSPRPTRAEVSDVANAIYDGTTAIMLSGESASGDYPAEAVKAMSDIAEAAEASINYVERFRNCRPLPGKDFTHAVGIAACDAAHYLNAKAIIVVTRSSHTAHGISNNRPACPIIAVVLDEKGLRQSSLLWGVTPVKAQEQHSLDSLFSHGIEKAISTSLVRKGDLVVIVAGSSQAQGEFSDTMKISIV